MHRSTFISHMVFMTSSPHFFVLLLAFLCGHCAIGTAQSDLATFAPTLDITFTFKDESTEEDLDKVTVIVWKNGAKQNKYFSQKREELSIELPVGHHIFDVHIQRSGYVAKRLRFDLQHTEPDSAGYAATISVALFQKVKAFDESVMEEPLGTMRYSPFTDNFEWDLAQVLRRKTDILEAKKRCHLELCSNKSTTKKRRKHVLNGRAWIEEKQFTSAMKSCSKALRLHPFDTSAIATYKIAKDSITAIAEKGKQLLYNVYIASGDLWFTQGDYRKALLAFMQAEMLDPGATYSKEQIARIRTIIENAERKQHFNTALDAANQAFHKGKFELAAEKYREALRYFPEDPYANEQLKKSEAAIRK